MKLSSTAILITALTLCGCIHHRTGLPASATNKNVGWTQGVTTRRDVVATWGNPHGTSGDTWIWRETISNGGKVKASYYMIGITVANTTVSTREHRLTFGADGRLSSWKITDSVSGGANWSLWPW